MHRSESPHVKRLIDMKDMHLLESSRAKINMFIRHAVILYMHLLLTLRAYNMHLTKSDMQYRAFIYIVPCIVIAVNITALSCMCWYYFVNFLILRLYIYPVSICLKCTVSTVVPVTVQLNFSGVPCIYCDMRSMQSLFCSCIHLFFHCIFTLFRASISSYAFREYHA